MRLQAYQSTERLMPRTGIQTWFLPRYAAGATAPPVPPEPVDALGAAGLGRDGAATIFCSNWTGAAGTATDAGAATGRVADRTATAPEAGARRLATRGCAVDAAVRTSSLVAVCVSDAGAGARAGAAGAEAAAGSTEAPARVTTATSGSRRRVHRILGVMTTGSGDG
ncbi:MAG TPA: hypothetical protein VM344_04735, partial [Vitreimonas sp.]|nr:hypothetical protein [Vitreimonas sp.]